MGCPRVIVLLLVTAACGRVATTPDAPPPCPSGLTACSGSCVNTVSDNLNCGDCDRPCGSGFACAASECRLTCQTGLVACSTRCVDPATDMMNCGASGDCMGANAGVMCGATEVCDGTGACASACQTGLVSCDGSCIDPTMDEMHCGASGSCQGAQAGTVCGPSETCMGSVCVTPPTQKRVFVTSMAYSGNLGGLAGADALCQTHANNAGLSGTYLAWLTDTAASATVNRFTHAMVPYVLVDGTVIATNFLDLTDGALLAPIRMTETGGLAPIGTNMCGPGFHTVYSNVNADGTMYVSPPNDYSCQGWTTTTGQAEWGLSDDITVWWTTWCTGGSCAWTSPIYCFQQ